MKKNKLKRIRRFFNLTSLVLFVVLLGLCSFILMRSPDITFNVNANTERIEFKSYEDFELNWFFQDVVLIENTFPSSFDSVEKFTGFIKIPAKSLITIERRGFGAVIIKFNKNINNTFSVDLTNESADHFKTLTETFKIYIDNVPEKSMSSQTMVLPINGLKGLFQSAPAPKKNEVEANIPILRSGNVKLMSQSLLNTGLIENSSFDLQLGDQFEFNEPENLAYGFIAINELPNLSISYNVSGKNGTINKPGGVRRNISLSLINQIINDKLLSMISILLGAILTITAFLSFYMEYTLFKITLKNEK